MSQTIDAWPLAWPATWPRTDYPERSRFGVSFATARDELLYELDLLGATDVVISSNFELRRDGLPYANRPEPIDTGVAIYFTIDGRQQCIPVDRWDRVKDNLRAAGLTIQALRGLERWGAKHMVDAAFAGFAALPAGGTTGDDWWTVLGVPSRMTTYADVRAAYLRRVKETHPDNGGDPDEFRAVSRAYDQAMEVVS